MMDATLSRKNLHLKLAYTNWRGETSIRTITPDKVYYGTTEWHPEPQWLLTVYDHDKLAVRDFALKGFGLSPDRERELLDANNRYQQEARDARAALKGDFQDRVRPFMVDCFGEAIAADGIERNHRFLEESLELVQSLGCTANEAHQLVDYVFGRPIGDPHQEAGGVMVTFAALCNAHGISGAVAAENELTRCWGKIDKIRTKQAAKPKHGPLPEHQTLAPPTPVAPTGEVLKALKAKAETQRAYFNEKQHQFPSVEDFTDADGNLTLPDDISPLLQHAEANGRYSEADWWLYTISAALAGADGETLEAIDG
ncbi:hypothetical protein NKH91_17520 [Mesorhizobium sp. M0894]|uniref:hypothetical protein n=1 Tax=unclassified Mesorhizobium TaxID=325217 RepID=UPI0033364748